MKTPSLFAALVLFSLFINLHAAELDFGPQDPNADKLVQQLGDENYDVRNSAADTLKQLGPQAITALQSVSESPDPEVNLRASKLLSRALAYVQNQQAYKAWQKLIPAWQENLKEGRLCGPLLGASKLKPTPLQPFVETFYEYSEDRSDKGWLARAQEPDGHWDSKKLGAQHSSDIEQTSLVLLALLGAGHTEKVGKYKKQVKAAIAWLRAQQRSDGAILPPDWDEPDAVAHALAAQALCEAVGMSRVPETMEAAQKATDYSTQVLQSKIGINTDGTDSFGGFGRTTKSAPDLFTTTLFIMQFRAAKLASLEVPTANYQGVLTFLDSIKATSDALEMAGGEPGLYAWVPGGKPSAQATWYALLCRQYLCFKREELSGTVELAFKSYCVNIAGQETSDLFTTWIATIVSFRHNGQLWVAWNNQMKPSLVNAKVNSGEGEGSWDPAGLWAGSGRVFATAASCLCLEVYWHVLPPTPNWK